MKIFVYGSLREGFFNFKKYINSAAKKIELGEVKGRLYAIRDQEYPALLEENGTVIGEIITVENCDLEAIDKMENYFGKDNPLNEYNKIKKKIKNLETGKSEFLDVYVYNTTNPSFSYDKLIPVTSGDWKEFKK